MGPGNSAVSFRSTPCSGGFRSSKRSSSGAVSASLISTCSPAVRRIKPGEKVCTLNTVFSVYTEATGQAGSHVVGNLIVIRKHCLIPINHKEIKTDNTVNSQITVDFSTS